MSSVIIAGDTSGSITLAAPAVAGSGVLTLPVATDTLVGKATTDTLTNKTLTAPVLGTPASGILTSCTGLNYDGFKSRLINGAMVIDQRNAGAAVTVSTSVNTFPVDRMALLSPGATTTAQRVAGTGAYTYDVLYTGAASVTASYLFQRIESVNCLDLVSKNVTFQVQLSSTTVNSVAVGLYSGNSTDTFTAPVSISTTTFTITSTPTIYTWTVNAGANAANGLQIQLNFGAFTSGTARISGMQLEKGSTATSFDYRPYGTELALCQRYFTKFVGSSSLSSYALGEATSSTKCRWSMQCPVVMRASPTFSTAGSGFVWAYDRIGSVLTALTLDVATTQVQSISAAGTSLTTGQAGTISAGSFTDTSMSFTSEL